VRDFQQVPLGRRAGLGYRCAMSVRSRKFIGILLTLAFMATYALVAMAFGGVFIVGKGAVFELAFYVVAGLAWLPVEMMIIRWMSKPDSA
jgi:uncharacterized membrane protein